MFTLISSELIMTIVIVRDKILKSIGTLNIFVLVVITLGIREDLALKYKNRLKKFIGQVLLTILYRQ